jgi:hypothetical protein
MAAPVLGPRGKVYCIEPLPDVCAALQLNAAIYQQWADKKGLQVAPVVSIQAGLSMVLVNEQSPLDALKLAAQYC